MEFGEGFGKKRDDEVSAWTVAIGEVDPFAIGEKERQQREAIEYIKTLPGFIGVHPVIGRGTLLLFKTEKLATEARQKLMDKGCPVGDHVGECFVQKKYMPDTQ